MGDFMKKVEMLRWDDHRYYHQCRINQTLHLISAISFLVAYGLLFVDPAAAAMVGWLVGMVTRQSGHIFFEPRGYDRLNGTSYENKEAIKVGFNMRRKAILIGVWLSLPVLLYASPSLFGLIAPAAGVSGWLHDVGLSWLALSHRAPFLLARAGVGPGLGGQDPDRPVQQRGRVLEVAAGTAAGATLRPARRRRTRTRQGVKVRCAATAPMSQACCTARSA
jgi:hypothetical protein